MGKVVDLIGMTFCRLTVIKRDREKEKIMKSRDSYWLCQCNCGNPNNVSVSAPNLKNNNTKSCGCLNSELVIAGNKRYNTSDMSGEYGLDYTEKGEEFYFDLEDYEKIKKYTWCLNKDKYVLTRINSKLILFHRLVMNAKEGEIIDHIFAKTNDNRKSELRFATKAQNCQNAKTPSNNTSGVKGVIYNKQLDSWGYEIWCNNERERQYGLTYEKAVKARQCAEVRLHKEFRRINKIKEENI